MKKIFQVFTFLVFVLHFPCNLIAQTLSDTQMQNARATGYAIVAARNPGQSFSIYMIPWDGVNTLEYNANNQINSGWHAQAVVKGNYFTQSFDGTTFTGYSTVITSQEEFDVHKGQGTQWWIVCSTLGPFATTIHVANNGNVGVGTISPGSKLEIRNDQPNTIDNYMLTLNNNGTPTAGMKAGIHLITGNGTAAAKINVVNDGNAGGDLSFITRSIGNDSERLHIIAANGNVGIGTSIPSEKLSVNGKIRAREIKVEALPWPDYVFKPEHKLSTLPELEQFIKVNNHLPEIPSAAEVEEDGINLGEMNAKLLKKIEELTLHLIEKDKELSKEKSVNQLQQQQIDLILKRLENK